MMAEVCAASGCAPDAAEVVRTIYDSLALSYKQAVDELEANTGASFGSIHIIGGGSRDGLLNGLTAEATGKRVVTGPVEATAIGNMIMQMIGAGEIEDVAAARDIIRNSFDIQEVQI